MQLNHLHLHVASVERAAAFYERHFGFRPYVWHGDVLFMRDAGGLDFALAPGAPGELPPWFHFGFRLESAEAVRALHASLLGSAVPVLEPLTDEGDLVYFRCADPDGHGIEVYWEIQPGEGSGP